MPNKQIRTAHTQCLICGHQAIDGKKLTFHIKSSHGLKAEEYTEKHIYKSERKCPICGKRPRYVAFTFKEYCRDHASHAEAKGGAKGGKAEAWNKGQTVKTDERILKSTFPSITNPFFGKRHTEEAKKANADKHRLSESEFNARVNAKTERFTCLSTYSDYRYRQGQKLLFRCVPCQAVGRDTIIEHTLLNFERNPICKICHPGGSKEQLEIADFIRSLGITDIIYNDRTVIAPKELDILVPSKKFAVEYDSFYYHIYTDEDPREDRHYEKTTSAHAAGIDLLHVFQDEWRDKPDIVRSMIMHRLGMSTERIDARKCQVRQISTKLAHGFFEANHIAGGAKARHAYGLFRDERLVAAMSIRRPWQRKHKERGLAEICRFACLTGVSVRGGLGRLLHAAIDGCKGHGFLGMMTYADLRYGRGLGYERVGFKHVGWTGLSYDYTDGTKRFHRFKFRADPTRGLSERQVAQNAGVNRIYGCGNNAYELFWA